jgi:hypothetical protein
MASISTSDISQIATFPEQLDFPRLDAAKKTIKITSKSNRQIVVLFYYLTLKNRPIQLFDAAKNIVR